jgi:hypothetical protein
MVRANWVIPVPKREASCPNQKMENSLIPERYF